ncbi:DUF2087 domain-containing protein [Microbacterium sp. CFBP9034]|uniref:DUF2087 domain-containing protein n=1 Tax=Microbacterium sp. CFBP9034 TaxID=3096540 RepID=UPI002A6AE68F|nr:DUF2087 domain-containing protein [Microbacterium sp. CFBP9034]MDY0909818.1 DUF2087 domain-containing protein [Microbacterium sp. CFBP9034]
MSDRWRGVLAALLNPDLRAVLAEAMSDDPAPTPLTAARRGRAIDRLQELGLVRLDGDVLRFDEAAVRGILNETPVVKPAGAAARYLDGQGRIDRMPVRETDRRELLEWVAARAFRVGETLDERAVNERLAVFTGDAAALRRHLVDAALLERTPSGSEYALVGDSG